MTVSRETPPTGEVCKRCFRANCIGFSVPDEVWAAVVRSRWTLLCPLCFDEEAKKGGVPYEFTALYPVTWSTWADTKPAEGQTTALPDLSAPCPHPDRNGRHEVYVRPPRHVGSKLFCRACGAEPRS